MARTEDVKHFRGKFIVILDMLSMLLSQVEMSTSNTSRVQMQSKCALT